MHSAAGAGSRGPHAAPSSTAGGTEPRSRHQCALEALGTVQWYVFRHYMSWTLTRARSTDSRGAQACGTPAPRSAGPSVMSSINESVDCVSSHRHPLFTHCRSPCSTASTATRRPSSAKYSSCKGLSLLALLVVSSAMMRRVAGVEARLRPRPARSQRRFGMSSTCMHALTRRTACHCGRVSQGEVPQRQVPAAHLQHTVTHHLPANNVSGTALL